jgi:hypothetical protein
MNSYILWIMILEGCYQGLHWGLKLLEDLRSRRCLLFNNYQTSSSSFFSSSHNPSYYSLLVMICDANSMQVVQPHPPCVTCQRPLCALLVGNVVPIIYLNNFEAKYSKFSPLGSLVDFGLNCKLDFMDVCILSNAKFAWKWSIKQIIGT